MSSWQYNIVVYLHTEPPTLGVSLWADSTWGTGLASWASFWWSCFRIAVQGRCRRSRRARGTVAA